MGTINAAIAPSSDLIQQLLWKKYYEVTSYSWLQWSGEHWERICPGVWETYKRTSLILYSRLFFTSLFPVIMPATFIYILFIIFTHYSLVISMPSIYFSNFTPIVEMMIISHYNSSAF